VENGVWVVRCGNTGVSCFIDPRGRVVSRVRGENGEDLFVQGVLTGTVVPATGQTLYTRFGDWPVAVCGVCAAGFLAAVFFQGARERRRRRAGAS
jgi:apolipoprotein N-acyltransferase